MKNARVLWICYAESRVQERVLLEERSLSANCQAYGEAFSTPTEPREARRRSRKIYSASLRLTALVFKDPKPNPVLLTISFARPLALATSPSPAVALVNKVAN
jgi:hypothetical protein